MPVIFRDMSPSARRRVSIAAAVLLLLALGLSACNLTVSDTLPGPTSSITPGSTPCPDDAGLSFPAYSPTQMRVAYGVESLCQQGDTGKGETVVVIDSFGSPTLQQDIDKFSDRFGLPRVTLDIRTPLGAKPFNPSDGEMGGWAGETTLDVETIHAMAPGANIVVLTSPVDETEGTAGLPEFRQLEEYAVDNHLGTIVSQSFGASEISLNDAAGQAELAKWNSFYQQATTQQGITFVASSGDGGATDYANAADARAGRLANVPTTGFPADSPWVLAIGGTRLTLQGSSVPEVAWSGSGGGFSRFNAEPSYQQLLPASGQTELNNRRGVPDVAASADPSRGLITYESGQGWQVIGGTSASAPLWAGILAVGEQVAGHSLGFVNPAVYKIGTSDKAAQDFRDITSGNNSQPRAGVQGYNAVAGWDPVTGFGAPVADKLLPDLIAALSSS
jgi:subtilase family serine protease